MKEAKKLRRSKNRIILGVIGGFADYFKINPNTLRILVVIILLLVSLVTHIKLFTWVLVYIVMVVLMPAPVNGWQDFLTKMSRQSDTEKSNSKREIKDIDAVEIDVKDTKKKDN